MEKGESTIRLGRSALLVSTMGMGTSSRGTGRTAGPGLRPTYEAAPDAGITFVDTTEIYTRGARSETWGSFSRLQAAGSPWQPRSSRDPGAYRPARSPARCGAARSWLAASRREWPARSACSTTRQSSFAGRTQPWLPAGAAPELVSPLGMPSAVRNMVKPHGGLVLVSSVRCRTYTSSLSTWLSPRSLLGDLLPGGASS